MTMILKTVMEIVVCTSTLLMINARKLERLLYSSTIM